MYCIYFDKCTRYSSTFHFPDIEKLNENVYTTKGIFHHFRLYQKRDVRKVCDHGKVFVLHFKTPFFWKKVCLA